jgi:hypothetical protein
MAAIQNWRRKYVQGERKINEALKAEFLHVLSENGGFKQRAAAAVGTTSRSILRAAADDPEFAEAIEEIMAERAEHVRAIHMQWVEGGEISEQYDRDGVLTGRNIKPVERLILKELEATDPERYSSKQQVEHKASGGGVLVVPGAGADMIAFAQECLDDEEGKAMPKPLILEHTKADQDG